MLVLLLLLLRLLLLRVLLLFLLLLRGHSKEKISTLQKSNFSLLGE